MRDYEFRPRAVRDIASARDWYDGQQADLGNKFFDAVLMAVREAREHAERFPQVNPTTRALRLTRFPYRVYYATRSDRIIIRAVYHTHRDPDRWADEDRD